MTQDLAKSMKEGMRRLAAGVCVISTTGLDDKPYAMTVTSVTSVSDAPVSLLVCVHKSARIHSHMQEGRDFAIHVLSQAHQAVSVACSTGDQGEARFNVGNWYLEPPKPPILRDAEANFICRVNALQSYGTHTIVIGDIHQVLTSADAPNPLLYHNGAYARLSGKN